MGTRRDFSTHSFPSSTSTQHWARRSSRWAPTTTRTSALGPTEFALGSHDDAHAATRAPTLDWDDTYVKVAPTLRRGDVVLFGYDMVHRGRPNAGQIDRPVFYATLAPPGATDDANF